MTPIAPLLEQARESHRAGAWPQAEAAYRQVLQLDPRHAEATHLLGIVLFQTGRREQALEHLTQSLALDPGTATFQSNMGYVFQELGRLAEAVACYRRAVQLQPAAAALHNNLGSALARLENYEEAVACYREAVRLQPDFAQAHHNLGFALAEQGRLDEAAASYREAVRWRPDYAEAHNNLGNVLRVMKQPDDAVAAFREALRLQPGNAVIHANLGNAYLDGGRPEDAVTCYHHALRLQPEYAKAYSNLGYALTLVGQPDEAAAACREALRLEPDYADALHNLGIALLALGQVEVSLACTERALGLQPEFAEARLCRALGRLLTGDWEQGWPEYEWRWRSKTVQPRLYPQPRWDGSPLGGRTIFLWTEQGLGDTLQFIRYAALVKQHGGTVVAECQRPLLQLLSSCPGIDVLTVEGSPPPVFDVQAPLLSLPAIFGTTLSAVPAHIPYLFADPRLVERWRLAFSAVPGFRVGIAWQGDPKFSGDRLRSIPLRLFGSLARVEGVRLISLQKGPGVGQLQDVRGEFAVRELGDDFDEASGPFMDTAAVMKHLDLVVTSDTAVAHLAGALGVPVWVALPLGPDWRWMLDRGNSPWYPTMRLFRQSQLRDWNEVFSRIQAALKDLTQRRKDAKTE